MKVDYKEFIFSNILSKSVISIAITITEEINIFYPFQWRVHFYPYYKIPLFFIGVFIFFLFYYFCICLIYKFFRVMFKNLTYKGEYSNYVRIVTLVVILMVVFRIVHIFLKR